VNVTPRYYRAAGAATTGGAGPESTLKHLKTEAQRGLRQARTRVERAVAPQETTRGATTPTGGHPQRTNDIALVMHTHPHTRTGGELTEAGSTEQGEADDGNEDIYNQLQDSDDPSIYTAYIKRIGGTQVHVELQSAYQTQGDNDDKGNRAAQEVANALASLRAIVSATEEEDVSITVNHKHISRPTTIRATAHDEGGELAWRLLAQQVQDWGGKLTDEQIELERARRHHQQSSDHNEHPTRRATARGGGQQNKNRNRQSAKGQRHTPRG